MPGAPTSRLVYPGTNGHLVYTPDSQGNLIPDFSEVGYQGGKSALYELVRRLRSDRLGEGLEGR